MREWLRRIPAVHELQHHGQFAKLMVEKNIDFNELTNQLKEVIVEVRQSILDGHWSGSIPGTEPFTEEIFQMTEEKISQRLSYTLERVINASGTILHTNLGRARLSEEAVAHVLEVAQNYSNLEYKLEEGARGSRHSHAETLIKKITGAEAAMVVNNNAAAVFLVLRALAANKEVIVSRGQLVEIGGSFRISSIMEESGAKLVEVGTTNKTHLYDYEKAVTPETAIVMKVHTSNFKVIGFTESVETKQLIDYTKALDNIVFYEDLGSGALYDLRKYGIGEEPVVKEVIAAGADLVSFSGDKLLGGPQAGIIAGKKELIDRLKNHQLARVLRVDKMTLAALEGTLIEYLKGGNGVQNIPTIRDLLLPIEQIKERSIRLCSQLQEHSDHYETRILQGTSQVGGGTLPGVELPTVIIALKHRILTASHLSQKLRMEVKPAVVTRIQKDEIILDLRTVSIEEDDILLKSLIQF